MPVRDYRTYAQSDKGRAARERAHQRYTQKRRAQRQEEKQRAWNAAPLAQALKEWMR